jgi:cytosine/adenosine deaminase-related metal-dependent hydrolase
MHLAESPDELELLAAGTGLLRELLEDRSMWDGEAIPVGSRPLDYLRLLAEAPRAVVIHGNYLAADEIALLGERRDAMSLVYCPRTHAYFGHPTYPLEAMLAAGVRVALGTDSRASNPDLGLLAEMRFAAARHPGVSPTIWVRMATTDAAAALGLGDEVGALAPGQRADMVALPWWGGDPLESVVRGEAIPVDVWLAGVRALPTDPGTS